MKLLEEEGIDFTRVDYYKTPFTEASLGALLEKAGLAPRDVLRKRAPQYKELALADDSVSDAEILAALVEHPDLLERPIVEKGNAAVLARPVQRGLDLAR